MPKGPDGQQRPTSEVSAAVIVGKIATRQITEPQTRRLTVLEYGTFPRGPKLRQDTPRAEPVTQ